MKIGEIATRAGVSTKTIRYYENIGVIPDAERAPNGYRTYDQTTVDRLSFVRDAQAAGLSLTEINLILALRDEGETTCHHVISMLESHLNDVDRQLAELTRTRQRLEEMTRTARELDPSGCTDPNRCQTIQTTKKEPT